MKQKIINFIIFAAICAGIYGLLSHHIVFYGRNVTTLKKANLTFENTLVNVSPTEFRTPKSILENDVLREAGVGDVMVDFGIITDDERNSLIERIEAERY